MSSTQHTPGPWMADFRLIGGRVVVNQANAGDRMQVALVNGGADEQDANARLIAAAPDLLAALLHIVNDTPTPGGDAVLTVKGYNMACAAIARAEGRGA